MVQSENQIIECLYLTDVHCSYMLFLLFVLSHLLPPHHQHRHMAPPLVNTENALNINVQFTRFLASGFLKTSLPRVKKLSLDQT